MRDRTFKRLTIANTLFWIAAIVAVEVIALLSRR